MFGDSYKRPFPCAKNPTGLSASPRPCPAADVSADSSSSSSALGSCGSSTPRRDGVRNGENAGYGERNFFGVMGNIDDAADDNE